MKKQIQIVEIDNGYLVQHQILKPVNRDGKLVFEAEMIAHHCAPYEVWGYVDDVIKKHEADKEDAAQAMKDALENTDENADKGAGAPVSESEGGQ